MSEDREQGLVNERLLNQMKIAILQAERRNLNTGEKTNDAMVESIKKTIINTADKSY